MKLLLTGFDPFGGEEVNPSWEAVNSLPDTLRGAEIKKLLLPTAFTEAARLAREALEGIRPGAVLCVGQAGGSTAVRIERVGVNLRDARIPDNLRQQPVDEPIDPGGPCAYFSTLPTRRMLEALRGGGIAAELSYSAGTFVCNELLYSVLRYAEGNMPGLRAGFIHLPYLPEQAERKGAQTASMELSEMVRALELAAAAVIV